MKGSPQSLTNYDEARLLQNDVKSRRGEQPIEDDDSGNVFIHNIPHYEACHHGADSASNTEDEAENTLTSRGNHTDGNHNHGPEQALSYEEDLGLMQEVYDTCAIS